MDDLAQRIPEIAALITALVGITQLIRYLRGPIQRILSWLIRLIDRNRNTQEQGPTPPPEPPEPDGPYVGNRDSKVFHHHWCSSVRQMRDDNKRGFRTREEAMDLQFRPCGRCKP
jgi:hypothetical protein